MMKAVIGDGCELSLSSLAIDRAMELGAKWAEAARVNAIGAWDDIYIIDSLVPRHDTILVRVFEELGTAASAEGFVFVEVPDDVRYSVKSSGCSGEWLEEEHRVWVVARPKGTLTTANPYHISFVKGSTFDKLLVDFYRMSGRP